MDEYMTAADFMLGKPGGLTTSEALAKGLVLVIVNPIPGQEERNSDHLLEEGVAIRCNNLPALAYKVDRLLNDPQRLAAMRGNVSRVARRKRFTKLFPGCFRYRCEIGNSESLWQIVPKEKSTTQTRSPPTLNREDRD